MAHYNKKVLTVPQNLKIYFLINGTQHEIKTPSPLVAIKYSILLQTEVDLAITNNPNTSVVIISPPKDIEATFEDFELVLQFINSLHQFCKFQEYQYNKYNESQQQQDPNKNNNNNNNKKESPFLKISFTNENNNWYGSFKLSKVNKKLLFMGRDPPQPGLQNSVHTKSYLSLEGNGPKLIKMVLLAKYFDIIDNYLIKAYRKSLESNLEKFCSPEQAQRYFGDYGEEFIQSEKEIIAKENAFSNHNPYIVSTKNYLYNSMVDKSYYNFQLEEKQPTSPSNPKDQYPPDIVQLLDPRKPTLPLHKSATCYGCSNKMGVLNRHHCRECGMIFCNSCAGNFVETSDLSKQIYYGMNDYIYGFVSNKTSRVCNSCYHKIHGVQRHNNGVFMLKLLGLKFLLLRRFASVYPQWRRASIIYLSEIRMIQYKFPTHKLLPFEKLALWRNRTDFKCHSLWLLKLLCSIDYSTITTKQLKSLDECLCENIDDKKNCYFLMCSSSCQNSISPLNILPLLDKNVTHPFIRNYATRKLNGLKENLLYVLPQLTFLLRYEPNVKSDLQEFLFTRAKENPTIAYNLLWELKNCQGGVHDLRYEELKSELIKFFSINSPELLKSIQISFELSYILQQHRPIIRDGRNEPDINFLNAKLSNICKGNLLKLPTNPNYTIIEFLVGKSLVFNSATKPLYLVCRCINDITGGEEERGLIFKKDDLRKDQIILNLIYLMDDFIVQYNNRVKEKQEKFLATNPCKSSIDSRKKREPFMRPVVYRVIPTGVHYGFIEPVKGSKTLKEIQSKHPKISNFLFDTGSYDINFSNFSRSLATWNIITHLLGVGDRHNENVMFTEDCQIFHIDYGFILGMDPKLFNVVRNDRSFEEQFLENEKKKSDFYDLNVRLFLELRKHHAFFLYQILFLTRLEPKVEGLIDEQYIEDVVGHRFLPGVPKKEASEHLNYILKSAIYSFAFSFFDSIRSYKDKLLNIQETTKSVKDMSVSFLGRLYNSYSSASSSSVTSIRQQEAQGTKPFIVKEYSTSGSVHNHSDDYPVISSSTDYESLYNQGTFENDHSLVNSNHSNNQDNNQFDNNNDNNNNNNNNNNYNNYNNNYNNNKDNNNDDGSNNNSVEAYVASAIIEQPQLSSSFPIISQDSESNQTLVVTRVDNEFEDYNYI
ncbi:hypothetical protein DICPUDRAFT_153093 [Dictyostelium purpureum]|uniref:Phosphatidylinositol 3-kinase n=1 Tax=Dictyostelium purpureum TaxID=5786 RepID=F0ZN15_DICPU|nr:uncharacterized protein DICPUDRAFT_153093 [Dictyostelium purpureum]EGC34678.1 hypothetical protein DICPUDRAFT_153093 [Dictyostelium purpureum]|eukprot:XP_003288815.1 hypothetical protein DICPUDRAFT_153093 [Dictyostelium purpureum]